MKKTIYCLMGAAFMMLLTACGGSTTSTPTAQNPETPEATEAAAPQTVSPGDIDAAQVKLIITDEEPVKPETFDGRDYAGKTAHNVYDFSESAEITNYKHIVVTDPEQYEQTNSRLEQGNWTPEWTADHTTFTITKTFFGASNNATDIIQMEITDHSMTVIMKDGKTLHLDQVPEE